VKNEKFYQSVFALTAFLILFFKTPPKKLDILILQCMIFLCFVHRFHENYQILKILPKAFCFNRKNEIIKIVKFYQRVFALTRISILLMKKNIQ
tara:strand:+ start:68 stop:349 length:282 start_codon:yes stop_codon:yes gene_type:complete